MEEAVVVGEQEEEGAGEGGGEKFMSFNQRC